MEHDEKVCAFCAEPVKAAAIKCRHCGEFLDEDEWEIRKKEMQTVVVGSNPGVAAVLSTVFPGLGQIFHGRILEGLLFMAAIGMTSIATLKIFSLIFIVLALYIINIFDAYYSFFRLMPEGVAANLRDEHPPAPQEERPAGS